MPEGDTIFRAATTLHRGLVGRELVRFAAPRSTARGPAAGSVVRDVEARGKHLLVHFGGDPPLTLRTHLRMNGSWHLYRTGQRWAKSPHRARVVVEVDGFVAVCFDAPVVEVLRTDEVDRHPELVRLGPDLSLDDPDLDEAVRRLGTAIPPATEIGVALLDQRIACGVGNVFKSESLHACGVDPFATVAELDDAARRELLETAARQLRANRGGYPRRTVPEGLAVYGRAGERCRRCGGTVRVARQGEHARVTYWCPTCQTAPGGQ